MDIPIEFARNDRVFTPKGCGTVASVRMAPPTFTRPLIVTVILDEKLTMPGYEGSQFAPGELQRMPEPS